MKKPWKVVPLCERQLRDINESDVLNNGLYRRCDIYKGGGGYDKFSSIYRKRMNITDKEFNEQFVVQLYGCPLRCPYCYVTHNGVYGEFKKISTEQLIDDFYSSGLDVFHLMGGAPALYIDYWHKILERLDPNHPFHSDLLCVEGYYKEETLKN